MGTLEIFFFVGLALWLIGLPFLGAFVMDRHLPDDTWDPGKHVRPYSLWKPREVRQIALLVVWGPPVGLVMLYLALKQVL